MLYPVIAAVTGGLGLGATLLQYATSGPRGIWWLLVAVGLTVAGVGLGFVRKVRLDTKISGIAAAFGAIVATVALLGGLGMLQLPARGPGDSTDTGPDASSTSTSTSPASTPPTTPPASAPTGPAPGSNDQAVSLTVEPPDDNLDVKSKWTVNQEAPAGHERFLVAVVPQVAATGASHIDFFPKIELGGPGEEPTSKTFSLLQADPRSSRKVAVISVPDSCAADLRLLIAPDAPRSGTPCPGQKWAYDSKAFTITKP